MAIVICDKIAEINCLLESRCVQAGMIALENVLRATVIVTSPPIGGGRGIVMPMSVCLCVCVFVCVFVRVFAKFQSVISQPFLNRSL